MSVKTAHKDVYFCLRFCVSLYQTHDVSITEFSTPMHGSTWILDRCKKIVRETVFTKKLTFQVCKIADDNLEFLIFCVSNVCGTEQTTEGKVIRSCGK